jgi:hypothetical protein
LIKWDYEYCGKIEMTEEVVVACPRFQFWYFPGRTEEIHLILLSGIS